MPELTAPQLAALDGKSYTDQIKMRLRDDQTWGQLLDPMLADRTRWTLNRMIASIDAQKERIAQTGTTKANWLSGVNALRRHTKARLDAMGPEEAPMVSTSKEARAWRAFSFQLAGALEAGNPLALDTITTPYGGLTARQWLTAREQKEAAR